MAFWKKKKKSSNENNSGDNTSATESTSNEDIYQEDIRGSTSQAGEANNDYEHESHKMEKDAEKIIQQANIESKYRIDTELSSDSKFTETEESTDLKREVKPSKLASAGKETELSPEDKELSPEQSENGKEFDQKSIEAIEMKMEADFEVAKQKHYAQKGVFGGILAQLANDVGLSKIDMKKYEEIMDGQNVAPGHQRNHNYVKPQPDFPTHQLPGQDKKDN